MNGCKTIRSFLLFRVFFSSFFKTGANGVILMPKEGEKMHGGHAIVAVGYDNAKNQRLFIMYFHEFNIFVLNSM